MESSRAYEKKGNILKCTNKDILAKHIVNEKESCILQYTYKNNMIYSMKNTY